MRVPLRVQALAWLVDRLKGRDGIAKMGPAQLARARAPRPSTGLAGAVFGRNAPGVTWADGTVSGHDGTALPARIYRPEGPRLAPDGRPRPLVVFFHGGGWVTGSPLSSGWTCTGVAAATGAVVVSAGYRLAPEHRFPAAVLDSYAAVTDLVARAGDLGTDPARVALLGESAGANLAAVVSLLARDARTVAAGGPGATGSPLGAPRILAQALVYPPADARAQTPSSHRLAGQRALSRADLEGFLELYLGPDGDRGDPRVSPLLAGSHAGLPPTLIQTAEHDLLVDDGQLYAQALADDGVPVQYTCYQGVPHGFVAMSGVVGQQSRRARDEICAFLGQAFAT